MSYALELGKTSPVHAVGSRIRRTRTTAASRARTRCREERFGTSPAIDHHPDKLAERTAAIGQLASDDLAAAATTDAAQLGPLALLRDERRAVDVAQLGGLLEIGIDSLYERRE